MVEISNTDDALIDKDLEFPGIVMVYSGYIHVEAVTHAGHLHHLETLYSNCAYGIYHAAQNAT